MAAKCGPTWRRSSSWTSRARCSPPAGRRPDAARASARGCARASRAISEVRAGRRRPDRQDAAVPLPDPRPPHVRLDAAGGRRDRVAAAAAGHQGRDQLRRARRPRRARASSGRARAARLRRPHRRRKRPVRGAGDRLPARRRPVLGRGRARLPRRRARAAVPAGRRRAGNAAKLGPVAREGDLGRARGLLRAAVGDGTVSKAGEASRDRPARAVSRSRRARARAPSRGRAAALAGASTRPYDGRSMRYAAGAAIFVAVALGGGGGAVGGTRTATGPRSGARRTTTGIRR